MADRQFDAYNSLPESEAWDGNLSDLPIEAVHEPITNVYEIRLPEEYENDALGWDVDKSSPKTPEEANRELRKRVSDHRAPDNKFWDYTRPNEGD